MATKYDSLLSQPGVSFGELAGAYLSSGRKKIIVHEIFY